MARTYKYHFIYHIRILVGSFKDYFYVGLHSTNNIDDGYCGSGSKVSRIINGLRKKGHKDSEIYERTILTFATSRKEVIELESIYVTDKIMKNEFCLNCKTGGEQCIEFSDETLKTLSNINKKRYEDPNEREKISAATKKRYEDPNEREKTGAATKKRYEDPNEREKISSATKKRYEDPNEREKTSITVKKALEDPKTREKISEKSRKSWRNEKIRNKRTEGIKKNYKDNPITRKKQSKSQTKRYEDPNEREKSRIAQIKRYEDPNEHKKSSDARKKYLSEHPEALNACGDASRGKTCVNNGIVCKRIPNETLDEFLANNPSWVRGMLKRKKSA